MKKTDDADAAADAAVVVVVVVDAAPSVDAAPAVVAPAIVAPTVANEADVARFSDEVKMDSVPNQLKRAASAREIPQSGKIVAALTNGTAVTQISSREKYTLVTFAKPGDASTTQMAWIPVDAFTPLSIDGGTKALTCKAPEVSLYADAPFCGKTCTADVQCGVGKACRGQAQTFAAGQIGGNVRVCTVFSTAVVDAGAPTLDSGAPFSSNVDVQAPAGTSTACTIGFAYVAKDKLCHRLCPIVAQCHAGSFCIKCSGQPVCASNAVLCAN